MITRDVHTIARSTNIKGRVTIPIPEFYDDAVCAQTDQDGFFPERGISGRQAKKVCLNVCTVREQCLEYALKNEERWGIWGGTTEHERRKMKKETA